MFAALMPRCSCTHTIASHTRLQSHNRLVSTSASLPRHSIASSGTSTSANLCRLASTAVRARRGTSSMAATNGTDCSTDDPLIMYVVLRRDLWEEQGWPLGSLISQGAHAATAALWDVRDSAYAQQYCSAGNIDHMRKVTLEVKGETQLRNLSEKLTAAGLAHKLWIEQPENYATCLATAPAPKSVVQQHVKKLKLCKGPTMKPAAEVAV